MSLIFCFSLFFSLIFVLPLMQQAMGLVMVILSLAGGLSLMLGNLGFAWYGFSLFLIYVGGLLVMFGYVVVLVPNFVFPLSNVIYVVFVGFFVGFFVVMKFSVFEGQADVAGYLYSDMGCLVLLGLGLVLFFVLVCVVKICYFHSGSLRPFVL